MSPYAWRCKGCKGPPIIGTYNEKPWVGPCPNCGRTRDATRVIVSDDGAELADDMVPIEEGEVISLDDAIKSAQSDESLAKVETGSPGVDWVLGGGVPPCGILIAAPPGAGKTTFLIELLRKLAIRYRVLFISTEESTKQLGFRFGKLAGDMPKRLRIASIRDLGDIEEKIREEKPRFVAIDSLHKITGASDDHSFTYSMGSSQALTIAADRLRALSTEFNLTIFSVAHVSKEGGIAGSNTLQHDQDVILYLNGKQEFRDGRMAIVGKERTLRCDGKGRFGETGRCARFQMLSDGMHDLGPWMNSLPPWFQSTHEPEEEVTP